MLKAFNSSETINAIEEEIQSKYKGFKKYCFTFLKWLILSIVVGVICGIIGTLFYYCVEWANFRIFCDEWLIFFLPFAGLLIVFLYRKFGIKKDKGTNLVIKSIRSDEKVPLRMTALVFVSTTLTHLCGGSAGREGAALQIGGGIGTKLGKLFKLDERGVHVLTMCGMSALFSALFGTPITAAIFSMEVISVGLMHYSALIPCLFASIIANKIALLADIVYEQEHYYLSGLPYDNSMLTYGKIIIIGLCCAIVGVIFCEIMHKLPKLLHSCIKNQYLLAFLGGLAIIILTLLVGDRCTSLYNGAGSGAIERAINGEAHLLWYSFIMKIIFTAITLSCGFKGGEIVPTFFIGATLGYVLGPVVGLSASFGAALGMIGMFCAVVNCPLASIILSVELFGGYSDNLMMFAVVCAVSYMMSGTYSLYSSQKIMYSKLEPEFINRNAK